MTLQEHTTNGISLRQLTYQEIESLADSGDRTARLYISSIRYNAGTSLPLQVDLIAWCVGILEEAP